MSETINIIKSPSDDREYRYLKLENELSVLLVHDQLEPQAAASLAVSVGSTANPKDYEGLAHFLEHMLFLGTEKYPIEKEFVTFIEQSGGSYNGVTRHNSTNYYFKINHQHLEQALDRFSSFFISPLFTVDATQREVNAVHSEYNASIQSDPHHQFFTTLMAFEGHPLSRFLCGSLETLNKEDLHAKMLEFYHKYYSANRMSLCMVGPQSLDEQERLARLYFSPIENKKLPLFKAPPLSDFAKSVKTYCVPVKDHSIITLQWPIPNSVNYFQDYKNHTSDIISHILGHEARGSLFSYFQSLGYAYSLSAGSVALDDNCEYFSIEIKLTDEGLKNYGIIIGHINNYIEMMKTSDVTSSALEKKILSESKWASLPKSDPMRYANAVSLAMAASYIETQHILCYEHMHEDFNEKQYKEILNCLSLDSIIISLYSKSFENLTDSTHKYYNFRYGRSNIDSKDIEKWKSVEKTDKLFIPKENPFMPEDFSIKSVQDQKVTPPETVFNEQGIKVEFSPDHQFNTPLADIFFRLESTCYTSRQYGMIYLLKKCIKLILNDDILYYAILNSTTVKFQIILGRISFRFRGYNDKLFQLILNVFHHLSKFELSEFQFELAKKNATKKRKNRAYISPMDVSLDEVRPFLTSPIYHPRDDINTFASVGYQEFVDFVRQFFKSINLSCIVGGNFNREEVLEFSKKLSTSIVDRRGSPSCDIVNQRRVEIQSGKHYHLRKKFYDENQVNSNCICFFQVGSCNIVSASLSQLYNSIVYGYFFDELRTKQQLGYIVQTASDIAMGAIQLRVQVQSNTKDADYLFDRITEYIEGKLKKDLEELSEEDFRKYVVSLQENLVKKKVNINQQMEDFIGLAYLYNGGYDFRSKQREYLDTVTKKDFLDFFNNNIYNKATRKLFIVQFFGKDYEIKPLNDQNAVQVFDSTEFKLSMKLYAYK